MASLFSRHHIHNERIGQLGSPYSVLPDRSPTSRKAIRSTALALFRLRFTQRRCCHNGVPFAGLHSLAADARRV